VLIDVLRGPPARMGSVGDPRTDVVSALGRIGPDARPAIPVLIGLLEDEGFLWKSIVAHAIGRIGGPEARAAIPGLERLLRSPDEDVRIRAAEALWRIDGRAGPAPAMLRESLRPGGRCRAIAGEVIGEMGAVARGEIPALIECLEDRSPHGWWTRLEAAIALWRIDPRADRTLPVLMDLLRDPGARASLATKAAQGLGEMGAAARDALPLLRELAAADVRPFGRGFAYHSHFVIEDEALRSAIDGAIRRIEGDLSHAV
jgi:HEAT repeat protein